MPLERKPKLAIVPPAGALDSLSPETREWVESVRAGWVMKGHHERTLLVAAASWDLAEVMRRTLQREGYTYLVPRLGAYRARPEVAILHDAELRFLKAAATLGLDDSPIASGPLAIRHGNSRR